MQDSIIHEEMEKIQMYFPNLNLSSDSKQINGELSFSVRYTKTNHGFQFASCDSSKQGGIEDVYDIEIQGIHSARTRVVREVVGRIRNLAKKRHKDLLDLHLYSNGNCCLGLFYPNENETISTFVLRKVYPYFIWQAYYEKYNKIPPWGEWKHDTAGIQEIRASIEELSGNAPCPCRSGYILRECCKKRDPKRIFHLNKK